MQAKGREKDEELALFFEMRRREKENEGSNNLLTSEELDDLPPDSMSSESSPMSKRVSSLPLQKKSRDEFLNSEKDKSDYDWLLTPPGTPLVSLEMESRKTGATQLEISGSRPVALRSRPSNIMVETASKRNVASKNSSFSSELNNSANNTRRPLSSEGPKTTTRRSATPTGRPTLPSATKAARSSTPSSRPSIVSTKSVAPLARSSTPTRSLARSSTPTGRPSLVATKSTARSATPTRQQSTTVSGRASSTSKLRPTSSNITAKSLRAPSPTVKSRVAKAFEMPGFSAKSSSASTGSNVRQSTPVKARVSQSGVVNIGSANRPMIRLRSSDNDEDSPVVMGTKMVERVVNMRKLAPPKREEGNSGGKYVSSDSLGIGRTLSKKSLDMAIRHMDIRRTMQSGNLRPLVTSIPASSAHSIRLGTAKNKTPTVSDSPHATSSNAGSESSFTFGLAAGDAEGNDSSVIEQGR